MANQEDLAKLKRRRATIQGSCTRINTFVGTIASAPITPAIIAQLEERRAKLDYYWSEYETVQTKVESQDENESNNRVVFEESFYVLTARIRELLNASPHTRGIAASHTQPRASNASDHAAQIRLPRLNLPTFSGSYEEWFPFFDTFQSIIHTNESIDDIQKLQYLRSCLTGDAKNIICSLEISAVNYEVAWNLLKERYDNKRVIAQKHIKALADLPSMARENACELRQIADGALRHLHALQALKRPTSHWDDLLIHMLSHKFDSVTMGEWQDSLTSSELPTFKQLIEFMKHRSQTLESSGKLNAPLNKTGARASAGIKRQSACAVTIKLKCNHCGEEHSIYRCPKFLALAIPQRVAEIRKAKLCANCLRSTAHVANKCPSGNCRTCKLKHNTLLHLTSDISEPQPGEEKSRENAIPVTATSMVVTHGSASREDERVILATAVVHAIDSRGERRSCRVLLDCGSQANFVSRKFLDSLGIKARFSNISISGINNTVTGSSQMAQVQLQSRTSTFSADLDCIVADRVTSRLPGFTLKRNAFEIPRNIELADPQFNVPADIDILIGAETFWQILCVGQIKTSPGHPVLQKTRLGWILTGRHSPSLNATKRVQSFHASISNAQLNDQLSRFWQLESLDNLDNFTANEALCERYFLDNATRDSQGRYIVKLPFKEEVINKIGDTKNIARKRLNGIERRLARDSNLKGQYTRFLDEYIALGHMTEIHDTEHAGLFLFTSPLRIQNRCGPFQNPRGF